MPKVSVIVTTYNRPDFLTETLTAIFSQTYSDIEVVLVDDGSTIDYVSQYADMFTGIEIIRKKNAGLSAARNTGVKHSTGEWIAFCDDDDVWMSDKLERQVESVAYNQNVGLIHGQIEYIDSEGRRMNTKVYKDGYYLNRRGKVFIPSIEVVLVKSPTPLIKRSLFEQTGGFNERIKVGEDVDFYMKAAYFTHFLYIDAVLAKYRIHNLGQLSQRKKEYLLITPHLLTFINAERYNMGVVVYLKALRGIVRRHLWEMNNNGIRLDVATTFQMLKINPLMLFDVKTVKYIYGNLKTCS